MSSWTVRCALMHGPTLQTLMKRPCSKPWCHHLLTAHPALWLWAASDPEAVWARCCADKFRLHGAVHLDYALVM